MEYCKLGKLVELKQGLAINSQTNHLVCDYDTDLALLRIADMPTKKRVVFMDKKTPDRYIASEDDIIYTRTGQVGLVFTGQKGVVHNNCFRVIPIDEQILSRKYLFWALSLPEIYSMANIYAAGSAQPDLPHTSFKKIKIPICALPIQNKIASILSAYDNLIENNNRRIRLLEQIAENLYKEWFVRFRFPGYEKYSVINGIPSDSSICQLKDFVIRRNKVLKRWDNLSLVDLSRMHPFEMHISDIGNAEELTSNVKQVCKYDLLFGSIRSYQGKCGYSPIDGAIAGSVYNFYPIQEYMFSFLLLLITSKPFIDYTVNYSNGTKMPVLNYKDLVRFKFPVLNDKTIYQKFNEIVLPMIIKIDNLNHQNWLLKRERDLLLPRLMSGKLEVNA